MKVGQLLKVLQAADPEQNVILTLGDDEYCAKCAKVELLYGECLSYLTLDEVTVNVADDNLVFDLKLRQENYTDSHFADYVKEFDEKYPDFKFENL